jgi:hypothetical protein
MPRRRPLTLEQFRVQASEILLVISRSTAPRDEAAYIGHWGRLFALLRKLRASEVRFRERDRGPWATMGTDRGYDLQLWLAGGAHRLPIRMPTKLEPGGAQLATDLPKIRNGAGVQPPPAL